MNPDLLLNDFPYQSTLNLSSLVNYWEVNLESSRLFPLASVANIKKLLDEAPELKEPIEDLSVLDGHKELLGFLMSAIMPPALVDTDISAALVPFNFIGFYGTSGYRKLLPLDMVRRDISTNAKNDDIATAKIFRAGVFILNKFYGTNITIDEPMLITIPNKETGLDQIYKVDVNLQFVDVIKKKELEPLSSEQISELINNRYDAEKWLKFISPDNFEFQGFSICQLVEVTEGETLSRIKYDLLKKDAVVCPDSFSAIQKKVRDIFKLPKLELGLCFFDVDNNVVSNQGLSGWNSFMIPTGQENLSCDYFKHSIYEKANALKEPVIVEDLELMPDRTIIEDGLLKKGIKNVAIAPLVHNDIVVGMLELGTPYVGKLNQLSTSKMDAVIPMFTAAVHREMEEMKTEVRALIQEECTAIHPSVEWRFLEEGYKILNRKNSKRVLGDIVFENVYPLYGLSDIRNSSSERNTAIQEDLRQNLEEAKEVITTILNDTNIPILNEVAFRVEAEIQKLAQGLNSGDESSVIDFLKSEIVPTFKHFKDQYPNHRSVIEAYEEQIDPSLGVIYNKRKDFEQSLMKINETIATYWDEVELEAQQIFPHYFEKYKTDGVEYNIYMGDSMVKGKAFNELYLRNFRLWQLIVMCEIAVKVEGLKSELTKPLAITQLILVHGEPLSIKFRKDEKRFDVDGAYNIRYEIVKKRIDKAYIRNTDERLTQPGKIAIVYSQQKEQEEYMRYIQYLQSINYLTDSIELHELEELQGANGLKAIRVEVNDKVAHKEFGNEVIKGVIEAINAE